MNITSENEANDATVKLQAVGQVNTSRVKKVKPKIMICNVNKEEELDDVKKTLIEKNDFLQNVEDIEEKIQLLFHKEAAGNTRHYIFKCEPEIRALIHRHGDRVFLQWGSYFIRDRYHLVTCYHCQRFGHIANKCPDVTKNADPICFKCAGNHRSTSCTNQEKKCINCVRHKKNQTGHSVNESTCPVLLAELKRIQDMTDHGY